jgi:hypothetical protein
MELIERAKEMALEVPMVFVWHTLSPRKGYFKDLSDGHEQSEESPDVFKGEELEFEIFIAISMVFIILAFVVGLWMGL